ncbi:MAG: hypothetical protein EZS26_000285 [Candidatus Ordinivivax streblomastigis]|uniref:Uncharacterized protein n=1 Tax=Candidatus Ordinivivax streblomastigis TaxID=2540710 RepID=A0A5M8P5V1_9BACT|nr:MAG: hypothetical protein EZS26_000285 [Candidatus Ordinivivax streblomastigis]
MTNLIIKFNYARFRNEVSMELNKTFKGLIEKYKAFTLV